MKKLEAPLQSPIDEGWSIQIYDRRRRLLCALEPSHGWTFLLGCCVGLVFTIVWVNMAHSNREVPAQKNMSVETPLLQVD